MKKLIIIIVFALLSHSILFSQNTWYVRPATTDITYGTQDGTSWENAWNGLESLNPNFQDLSIQPTDTIYICGTHIYRDTTDNDPIALQGKIGINSGLSPTERLVIRGDYADDPGVIWGHAEISHDDWTFVGNNVWSIFLPANYRWNWYFQDIDITGPNPESVIVLDAVNSLSECENTPGSTYSSTYANDTMYVHLTDGENPTHRVYSPRYGYSFDMDNYTNDFSPLHNIEFIGLQMYGMSISSNQDFTHFRWDDCKFAWSAGNAINFFQGQNYNEVINCDIGWCASGVYGIDGSDEGGANHILISKNYFHDIGNIYEEHMNSDEHAVGVQGGTDWIIEDNYIERCGSGPLLYAYTNQIMTNSIIRRNFIKDCDEDGSATGFGVTLQCDALSLSDKSGIQIYQNIVVNCVRGFYLNYEDGIEVFNNVAYNCGKSYRTTRNLPPDDYGTVYMRNNISFYPQIAHIEYISGTTPMNSDYNLFYPNDDKLLFIPISSSGVTLEDWQQYAYEDNVFDPNSIFGIPLFENSSGTHTEPEDFKLTENSPAIDVGISVGLTEDFIGNPIFGIPDIGAFEYQNTMSIDEDISQENLVVFPNPTTNIVHIPMQIQQEQYEIYSFLGKFILKGSLESGIIDLSLLSNGLYILIVKRKHKGNLFFKIIKQN